MARIGPDEALRLAVEGVLLDARIRPNYIGGQAAAGQPRRGHIPHAVSAPAPDNVTDYGNFTSKGVTGFPFRVVYFLDDDLLMIVAVAHSKQRPGYWRERVPSA